MFRLAIVVLAALVMSAPAVADDDKDVMATVNRFVDGFNKGDTGAAAAACADGDVDPRRVPAPRMARLGRVPEMDERLRRRRESAMESPTVSSRSAPRSISTSPATVPTW